MKKGFTLIELLVVVLIISILAAVAVPQYQKAVDKTRYIQILSLNKKIWESQKRYHLANGVYAGRFTDLDIEVPEPKSTQQPSEDIEYYYYKWGFCWITGVYTACQMNVGNGYVRDFIDHNPNLKQHQCWAAPKESKRANALCKALTGQSSSKENGNTMIYHF